MISSEYKKLSLLDLIMKVNGCDEKTALEKLRKEYLKIDDNIYTGYADLTYGIKDDEKGNGGVFLKYDLIALADYKCTYFHYHGNTDRTLAWKRKIAARSDIFYCPVCCIGMESFTLSIKNR